MLKTNNAQKSTIAPSITEFCSPDNESCSSRLLWVMAYIATNGSHDILVTTTTGDGSWSTPVNTGQQSKATPAITQDYYGCEELVIAFVADNTSNDLMTITSTDGGATWSSATEVGGPSSPQSSKRAPAITDWPTDNAPSAASDYGNALLMAYVANDSSNALIVTQGVPNDNCSAYTWQYTTVGTQSSKTAPAISTDNGRVNPVIAYVANNSSNDLEVTTSTNGVGTDWSPNTLVGSGQSSKTAPTLTECDDSICGDSSNLGQETIAYVANNSSNDLLTTTSTDDATDWSASTTVDGQSSQAAPALPSSIAIDPLPMVYVANNSKNHLLLTTSDDVGATWSASSKIKDRPRGE
ncbi:MAG: hypothetical protein WAM97_10325 [Acidimicrobiales bacterium]